MFKTIDRLQKKPERTRTYITRGAAFFLTLMVAGVWYTAGGLNLNQTAEEVVADKEEAQAEDQVASPLLIIKEDAQSVISSFTDKVSEFRGEFSSSVSNTTTAESPDEIVDSRSQVDNNNEDEADVIDFN